VNEEPTKLPRSGSQYRGRGKAMPTDKILDDAISGGEKLSGLLKKVAAFISSGGAGSGLGQALAALGVPEVKWWMTGGAAILFHLCVQLADVGARALRRINHVGSKVEEAMTKLSDVVRRMDAGQEFHESIGRRVSVLEAESAARREEAERRELADQAAQLGVTLDNDATVEEMRRAVKRAKSRGGFKPHPHRRNDNDDTAVQPPDVDFIPEIEPQ
jgi:hypothetical protein